MNHTASAAQSTVRGIGRSVGTVGLAILAASCLGYAFLWICGRVLPPSDSKIFLTYWGVVFGVGSALSPIEQEVSRLTALANVHGRRPGRAAVRTIAVGACVVCVFGLVLFAPPVTARLFESHTALTGLTVVAGLAFAAQFGVRGLLIGAHRVRPYSALLVGEATLRLLVLGAVVIAGMTGLLPLAIAVAVGSFMWLILARSATVQLDWAAAEGAWWPVTRRVLALMVGAALTATVLTGYPAMVSLLAPVGDPAKLGSLFTALIVARTPLLLLSPIQAMAVPTVVRLSRDRSGRHRVRVLVTTGVLGTLVLAAAGAGLAWLAGPAVVRLLFGPEYQVDGWAMAGMVWSSVLLAGVLLLAAVLVARAQPNRVMVVWAAVATVSAVILATWPGDAIARAVWGLVIAPTVGLALATALTLYPRPDHAAPSTASSQPFEPDR